MQDKLYVLSREQCIKAGIQATKTFSSTLIKLKKNKNNNK